MGKYPGAQRLERLLTGQISGEHFPTSLQWEGRGGATCEGRSKRWPFSCTSRVRTAVTEVASWCNGVISGYRIYETWTLHALSEKAWHYWGLLECSVSFSLSWRDPSHLLFPCLSSWKWPDSIGNGWVWKPSSRATNMHGGSVQIRRYPTAIFREIF